MLSVAEALERFERDCSTAGVSKWKLPTSGRPISLFGVNSTEEPAEPHRAIRAQDDSKSHGMSEVTQPSHPSMCHSGNVCPLVYASTYTSLPCCPFFLYLLLFSSFTCPFSVFLPLRFLSSCLVPFSLPFQFVLYILFFYFLLFSGLPSGS